MSQVLAAAVAALLSKNWIQLADEGVTVEQAMVLKRCDRATACCRLAKAKGLIEAGSAPRLRWHLHETAAEQVGMEWTHVADASRSEFPKSVASGLLSITDETAGRLPKWSYYADPQAVSRETDRVPSDPAPASA
jgi:hypothetical protein